MAAAVVEVIKSDEKSASRFKTESDEKMMIIDSVSSPPLAIENCASRSKIESGCRRCSWSDLPIDMLYGILCELPSLCDRIRARAVCKNWLLPLNEICRSSESQLPWLLLSFEWDDDDDTNDIQANLSRCKLFNPLYEDYPSSYYQQHNNGERRFDQMTYGGTKVCASKNGWVMFYNLSSKERVRPALDEFKFVQKTSFFVYNPFTKHTITLPDLITLGLFAFHPSFDIATFSSSPDEDDCVFLVVREGPFYKDQSFYATYCRRSSSNSIMGQQKWKIDQFKMKNGNGMSVYNHIKGSVYMDGIFYCVSIHGTLMSFNATLREWTNLKDLRPIPNDKNYHVFLVELNGELLMLSARHLLRELLVVCDEQLVQMLYVFDKSRKAWVRRENRYFKDRALALCLGTYGSFAFSVEGYHDFIRVTYYKGPLAKIPKITKLWIQPPSKF